MTDAPLQEPVDRAWDDEGVIPKELGPDTAFLFSRMTEETLGTVGAREGERVLDVGCGRGLDLASQGPTGATLYGFDGSWVMIRRAAGILEANQLPRRLTCGSAENLPFATNAFQAVYCKGAIDHFYDPPRALEEMVRILRPGGRLVVSVANFESLGCRMGRLYNRLHALWKGRELPRPHFWEIPADHLFRFHHGFLMQCLPSDLRLERDRGISLLWGFPRWGDLLRALPGWASRGLLVSLDRAARVAPVVADVIVIRGRKETAPPFAASPSGARARKAMEVANGEAKMKKYSRVQGLLLCLGTIAAAVLFLIGVFAKSYWALAIPVAIGFLWLLGLAFWIGWTLLTIRVEPHRD